MRILKRERLAAVAIVTALLFMVIPFVSPPVDSPAWLLVFGRLHPMLLHFPIVIILLLLLLETAAAFKWIKRSPPLWRFLLGIAAVSALASFLAGYVLFASGDYQGTLVIQHFQAAAVTTAAIFVTAAAYFMYGKKRSRRPVYVSALLISSIGIGVTSHLGAGMTHGQEYLTEYWPLVFEEVSIAFRNEEEMMVYEDLLRPVFEARCISCHHTARAKGGYLMTAYASLLKGGDSGKAGIVPGAPDSSELYQRVVLPEGHDDRMPPEGKTGLSSGEIMLLKKWIESGAQEKVAVSAMRSDTSFSAAANEVIRNLERYRIRQALAQKKMDAIRDDLAVMARSVGVVIEPDSSDGEGRFFTMAMTFPPGLVTNDELIGLRPYYPYFSKISLVSSGVDDAALYHLGKMVNLKELYLQKTNIDGSGLVHLRELPSIEMLNLSFTRVEDQHILDLAKIPSLKHVYLFGSGATPAVVDALNKYQSGVRFHLEEGPYQ